MYESTGTQVIKSEEDYGHTPQDRYSYYADEIAASEKMLRDWKKSATQIVEIFLGSAPRITTSSAIYSHNVKGNLNLFHSNIQTLISMLYGTLPKIDVSRRYGDSSDDVGRVAAETMERMLNLDVQENGSEYDSVLRSVLFDRLVPGLGCAKVRYAVETESVELEGVINTDGSVATEERMLSESVPVEYYFWGDVLWSWARNFSEVRWIAFRNYLTEDEVRERFGDHAADNLNYQQQKVSGDEYNEDDANMADIWVKAEIWEIWDKTDEKVCWVSIGYGKVLEAVSDPLGLTGFFPVPPFLLANTTTSLYIPTPDYTLAAELYSEIDLLQERIGTITEAVKVVGVYDSSADGIQRMLKEGIENDLIPVDNWALFAEKNGIKGQVDWLPLGEIVLALDKLRELRTETIGLLQQITGFSDIMRGGLDNQYEGVGQSQMKAKFGSVRVQALQDQFAQFASDLMQLKAEVIARHFSPETIAKQSNMQQSMDAELLPQAIELIKNPGQAKLQVVIRPESIAMFDYSQAQAERTAFLTALADFMAAASPMMSDDPATKPFLMKMVQWAASAFKGSQEIEGILDKAIEASEQEGQQPDQQQPDPAQQLAQAQLSLEQLKQQGAMQLAQAKAQADSQAREQDRAADIETAMASHQMKMAQIQADAQAKIAQTNASFATESAMEKLRVEGNILETQASADAEISKDMVSSSLESDKIVERTQAKLAEIAAATIADIKAIQMKPSVDTE